MRGGAGGEIVRRHPANLRSLDGRSGVTGDGASSVGGMSEPVALYASHTHLFAGARLAAADGRFPADPGRVASSSATMPRPTPSCSPATPTASCLAVDAYRTAAGQDIPAKRWRIRHVETDDAGAETGIVGARLP
jgi:hypothetical protein